MHSVADSIQVDSTGRRLALARAGTGTPSVILETGLGAEAAEWESVFQEIGQMTAVWRYDRANRGRSDPAPKPRSALDCVADLHALLVNAAIPRPVVLVGHSLGGLIVRLYAHQHPLDVAGLVLVDPMHEDQFERMGPLLAATFPDEPPAVNWLRAFWMVDWRDPSKNAEGIDLLASQAQAHAIDTLGDTPMLVLTSGVFLRELPPTPEAQQLEAQLQALRMAMHREWMQQSSTAAQIVVANSGHFIQREQPEVVVAAVRQMLETVRRR